MRWTFPAPSTQECCPHLGSTAAVVEASHTFHLCPKAAGLAGDRAPAGTLCCLEPSLPAGWAPLTPGLLPPVGPTGRERLRVFNQPSETRGWIPPVREAACLQGQLWPLDPHDCGFGWWRWTDRTSMLALPIASTHPAPLPG